MTGAAGIPASSAAPANTLPGKKISGKTTEEERPDLPELPIFADFFSHMESDRSIPDAMPSAPPEDLPSSDAAAETPAPAPTPVPMPASTAGPVPALQVAATHHEWFGGGDKAQPEPESSMQRKPPVSFRKAEPDASERVATVEEAAQTDLPLPASAGVGAPVQVAEADAPLPVADVGASLPVRNVGAPLPVAEAGAPPPITEAGAPSPAAETVRTTDVGKPRSAIAGHAAPPVAPAATPPEIAPDQTRQQTQLRGLPGWFPGQHPDPDKAARHTAMPNDAVRFAVAAAMTAPPASHNRTHSSNAPRAETSAPAAGAARGGQFVSANVQASLSALESVLSREILSGNANVPMKMAAEDVSARGQQQQMAMKDAGITSVRQETHFAPMPSQPPALQIAQRITHEMQMGAQNQPQADTPAEAQKPPVRVLHIQLSPPQLGPMTIRMSMQNGGLMIQLETANRETAQLITRDRDALSGMLRAAGYSVDGLNVQVTAAERGAQGQAAGQGDGFNQGAGQQHGSREASGRASDRGGRGGGQQGQSSNPGDQDAATPDVHSRGGVYL